MEKSRLALNASRGLEPALQGQSHSSILKGIKIVGFICDREGRHPQALKIEKIVNWPNPTTQREL